MLHSLLVPAKEKDSRWTMVVLHGLGDSLAGYRWLPEALDLSWLNYQLVNAPDHYFGGYSWYDFSGDPVPGIERSSRLLIGFLADLERQGTPPSQTFLFGFSQGCLLTLEVGLRSEKVLAGCIGISGYLHQPETVVKRFGSAARQQRFLITHGQWDPLIPLEPVRNQMKLLQAAGVQLTWREFAKEHTIAGEEEIGVIREFVTVPRQEELERGREAGGSAGSAG